MFKRTRIHSLTSVITPCNLWQGKIPLVRLSQSQRARQKLWNVQFPSLFFQLQAMQKRENPRVIIFFRNICPRFCHGHYVQLLIHASKFIRRSHVQVRWAEHIMWTPFLLLRSKRNFHGWNVILPPGISQMKAFSTSPEIPLKRPPFLDISALLSLPSGWESRHFEIFSFSPLSQVQTPRFFSKPMCHALVFEVPRFWISWLINCHSSSVSMETK